MKFNYLTFLTVIFPFFVISSLSSWLSPPAKAQILVKQQREQNLITNKNTAKDLEGVEAKNITDWNWAIGGEYPNDIDLDEITSFSFSKMVDFSDSYEIQTKTINEMLNNRVKQQDYRNSTGVTIIFRY